MWTFDPDSLEIPSWERLVDPFQGLSRLSGNLVYGSYISYKPKKTSRYSNYRPNIYVWMNYIYDMISYYIYIWMQHNMLASIDPWSNSVTSCWLWHSWDNQNKRMSPTTQRETSLIPSAASSYCCHYGTTENMSTWMIPKYPKWTWEVQANS
jgi:hypothetical protein